MGDSASSEWISTIGDSAVEDPRVPLTKCRIGIPNDGQRRLTETQCQRRSLAKADSFRIVKLRETCLSDGLRRSAGDPMTHRQREAARAVAEGKERAGLGNSKEFCSGGRAPGNF